MTVYDLAKYYDNEFIKIFDKEDKCIVDMTKRNILESKMFSDWSVIHFDSSGNSLYVWAVVDEDSWTVDASYYAVVALGTNEGIGVVMYDTEELAEQDVEERVNEWILSEKDRIEVKDIDNGKRIINKASGDTIITYKTSEAQRLI